MIDLFREIKILKPWPFQDRVIGDVMEYVNSYKGERLAGIAVAPTGSGKSLMIAHVVYRMAMPAIILQPSIELLEQNYEKFTDHGGVATVYSASAKEKNPSSVMFATPGSVVGKGDLFRKMFKIKALIIDECHYKVKTEKDKNDPDYLGMVLKFIEDLQPDIILGFTATPIRLHTSSYGPTLKMLNRTREKLFNDIISVVQISEVYDEYWKKLEYKMYDFDESKLILNSAKTEFTEESIKMAVNYNHVNNNICKEVYHQYFNEGKKSILVFVDRVESGHKMAEWLNSKGIKTVCIDGKTPKNTRKKQVTQFKALEYDVMINYGTFTTGFDHKKLDCVMFGRPTNSFSMLYQILGRLVRKDDEVLLGLFIDFCNNIKRLGYIKDITFEKLPGYGWGMFNGDELMTGRPLNMMPRYTKQYLIAEAMSKAKTPYTHMHFGKYKGTDITKVPNSYFNYCLDTMLFDSALMRKFEDKLFEVVDEREARIAEDENMTEHMKRLIREGEIV